MWSCRPLVLLPLIFSVFTAAGLWIVYFVALHYEKVLPLSSTYRYRNKSQYPPFISLAGNFPPASCLFSQVMNMAAFAGFIIAVLRYLQLKTKLDKQWLNIATFASFSVGCFGMTIVGNFQLLEMMYIHDIGTLLTFGLGTLYCWTQSYITLRVNLKNEGRKLAICRFLLSAAITLCVILLYSLIKISYMHSARCQWALVMFFLIFFGTFAIDFRHSRFEMVCRDTVELQNQPEASYVSSHQLQQL
ncbi:transmembrane protein 150C [Cyprinodon tularosa]|uniref:transmembrane protein 150C n=1 Tax=Cyprinodon tularosa TaxID=77115 RepID=UPI0018E1E1DB|nr:transmembrane protein 150C [Cyprinodon tularosa]XP_038142915.1 transmembrane protein 150C [Cyprinodon tularosa]